MPKAAQNFMDRIEYDTNGGCWLWTGAAYPLGYGILSVGGKFFAAHRHSYATFVGPIQDGMCILHKCDVPACVNPDHLRQGTKSDNMQDCVAKGRTGKPSPYTRLKSHEVSVILDLGLSINAAAKKLGRAETTVSRARRRLRASQALGGKRDE